MLTLAQLNTVSEIDFVYRVKIKGAYKTKMSERPLISTPIDSYEIFQHYWNPDKIEIVEEFKVMFLNRGNRVLQILPASSGGISGTVADPRIIIALALKVGACNIVLGHNHPSGQLKPSRADEELTTKLKNAAAFFDIKVIDHIIITSEGYYSFADEGII